MNINGRALGCSNPRRINNNLGLLGKNTSQLVLGMANLNIKKTRKTFEYIGDLVVVLLRTWNAEIWDFVEERIMQNVGEKVHMYGNTLDKSCLDKPWRWIMGGKNQDKSTKVIIIRPESYYKGATDEIYEKLRDKFAKYVEGCYFFKTSDLEALYCGEALKSKLGERMEVLVKQIKKNLEDIEEDYN